ncbi:MAG: hypothetical protein HY208_08150 [Nitrospirae bacterium]|nr:hypothetical protein [Nitrospirota bacterium]
MPSTGSWYDVQPERRKRNESRMGNAGNAVWQGFVAHYRSALQHYVEGAGEAALEQAYELGRRAIAEGLGVLEMAMAHEEALKQVLTGARESNGTVEAVKAAQFFAESLSPFEMTHRGFQEANAKLRSLSEHLQSVREEERAKIARDIHDELGQVLTCLKIDLSWVRRRITGDPVPAARRAASPSRSGVGRRNGMRPLDEKPLWDKTRAMLSLIDQTIQSVRRIATELRPPILDDLGLAAAIEWQAQEFHARTGIACRVVLPPKKVTLDQKRSTAMFRIFQEALINVARHAGATRVGIGLRKKGDALVLEVKDNGKGIAEKEITAVRSLGLLGMRERALVFGGEVAITGVPGRGTTVTVRIPIADS